MALWDSPFYSYVLCVPQDSCVESLYVRAYNDRKERRLRAYGRLSIPETYSSALLTERGRRLLDTKRLCIGPRSRVVFQATATNICVVLDLSPSIFTVEPQSHSMLTDGLVTSVDTIVDSASRSNANLSSHTHIFLTIVALLPASSAPVRTICHNWHVRGANKPNRPTTAHLHERVYISYQYILRSRV